MTAQTIVKFHLKDGEKLVTLSHGHIGGEYKSGVTYDCTPEEWEKIFLPTGLFEIQKTKNPPVPPLTKGDKEGLKKEDN